MVSGEAKNPAWSVSWPAEETLRRWVEEGSTHSDIAEMIGVTRQAVSKKMKQLGVGVDGRGDRMSRADLFPWTMAAVDHADAITQAMRFYNKQKAGGQLTAAQQSAVNRLVGWMEQENVVLDYDRATGFKFRPRDPELDDPDDLIRRPA